MTRGAMKVVTVIVLALATVAMVVMAWLKLQPQAAVSATIVATPSANASSPTPAATASGTDLASIATVLHSKDDATVLVVGDGSGDGANEWVSVWASNYLAKSHQVIYAGWISASNEMMAEKNFGTDGPQLRLVNASGSKPDMKGEGARVKSIDVGADVVILNYGNGIAPSAISAYLQTIRKAAATVNPDAVFIAVIQNPGAQPTQTPGTKPIQDPQLKVANAVRTWASESKIATVDVYKAFVSDPATRAQLVNTDGTPTSRGSRLWAKTMSKALTPK